jgi:hypothetical protein
MRVLGGAAALGHSEVLTVEQAEHVFDSVHQAHCTINEVVPDADVSSNTSRWAELGQILRAPPSAEAESGE